MDPWLDPQASDNEVNLILNEEKNSKKFLRLEESKVVFKRFVFDVNVREQQIMKMRFFCSFNWLNNEKAFITQNFFFTLFAFIHIIGHKMYAFLDFSMNKH